MSFDLNNLNPSVRFYWDNSKKEWIELRNVPIGELRRIRKETIKKEVEYYRPDESDIRPFRYESEQIDEEKLNELLWDYQITDWYFEDADGGAIPCTLENKLLLINNSTEFTDRIIKWLNQLAADTKDIKEKSEKN